MAGRQPAGSGRSAFFLERDVLAPATGTDPAGYERQRVAAPGGRTGDRAARGAAPIPDGGSELLLAGRYSVQDGPDEHGAFAGGASAVPGSPDCGIRGIAAAAVEDPRGDAEVRTAGIDARQTAKDGAEAEEDRFRHTDSRLVPRRVAGIADGYGDAEGDRCDGHFRRARD